jgi:hypothetical protein
MTAADDRRAAAERAADINQNALFRITSHEQVCVLRYESICARLKRIESILIGVAGACILGTVGALGTVLWALLQVKGGK